MGFYRFPRPDLLAGVSLAGIAQLVEHNLAKVGVASSSLVSRSASAPDLVFETAKKFPACGRVFFFVYPLNFL